MRRGGPAEIFTEVAPLWRDPVTRADRLATRIVRHLRTGGHVLDVGCGTGAVLRAVRAEAAHRGKHIKSTVGLDVASGMVGRARSKRGVKTAVGDARHLPVVDQFFDVVIATDVLQYVDDPARVLRELFRATLPGGTIILELAAPIRVVGLKRADVAALPSWSLLRRYIEMRRSYGMADIRRTLKGLGCRFHEIDSRERREGLDGHFLARLGRSSESSADRDAAKRLAKLDGHAVRVSPPSIVVARVPGPRRDTMHIRVRDLPRWTPHRVERALAGLPVARGYDVEVKPLRWRSRPHVQAFCEFDNKKIIIQIPTPFFPFDERVPYRAKRIKRRRRWYFRWYWRTLHFDRPDILVRYLYLHEYYHWYLREVRRKRSGAETQCDRFALQRLGARALTTASVPSG